MLNPPTDEDPIACRSPGRFWRTAIALQMKPELEGMKWIQGS
ncbi:MAG: hypothetical protein ACRC8Y_04265 [Chroococcales cyanobacterium]